MATSWLLLAAHAVAQLTPPLFFGFNNGGDFFGNNVQPRIGVIGSRKGFLLTLGDAGRRRSA